LLLTRLRQRVRADQEHQRAEQCQDTTKDQQGKRLSSVHGRISFNLDLVTLDLNQSHRGLITLSQEPLQRLLRIMGR
jgi:hypothetical protein